MKLLSLLLFLLASAVHAQYQCITNNNTIIVTKYLGVDATVIIPETINGLPVTSIGQFAFYYDRSLTSVTIPTNVTSIGFGAFEYCSSLAEVTIPNSVTDIAPEAFANCGALAAFSIPTNVTSITPKTFNNCSGLATVTIPASVTSIGSGAFAACPNLTLVYSLGNAPSGSSDATIFSDSSNATIYYWPGTTGWGATFGGIPTALWQAEQRLVTVTATANPTQNGTVIGSGNYVVGFTLQLSASANEGWIFTDWSDGNLQNPRTINVPTTNITYTANFQAVPAPTITTTNILPAGLLSNDYSLTFTETGGTAPFQWVATSKLPDGLSLSNIGTLGGRPTKAGTTAFNIQVTDSTGLTNTAFCSLTVIDGKAPFAALAGTYTGLILQTNLPTHASSGFIQLILTKTGTFTGHLTLAGITTTLRGRFDLNGNATNTVAGVNVALHVDLVSDSGPITGAVSGNGFQSDLLAELPGTIQVAPGTYTLLFNPSDAKDASVPQGVGYATLTISRSGIGSLKGVLNDGTKLMATAPVSQSGLWPLYVSLYNHSGASIGWVSFATNTTAAAVVNWFAPASQSYAAFTTTLTLIGSTFVADQSVDGNKLITLSGGGLVTNIIKTVTVNNGEALITNPGSDALTLKLKVNTGQFTGTFVRQAGATPIPFNGLLLQEQGVGQGLFQRSGQTGSISIESVP